MMCCNFFQNVLLCKWVTRFRKTRNRAFILSLAYHLGIEIHIFPILVFLEKEEKKNHLFIQKRKKKLVCYLKHEMATHMIVRYHRIGNV